MPHEITIECHACHAINAQIVTCSRCGVDLVNVAEKLTEACNERDAAKAEVERLGTALRAIRARAHEIHGDYARGVRHQQESSPKGAPLREVDVSSCVGGPLHVCLLWMDSVNTALGPAGIARSNEEIRGAGGERPWSSVFTKNERNG